MKRALGMVLVFGTIVMFIFYSVPRLFSEIRHARQFVPAQHFTITHYKCTNWNGFMFNECTTTFVSERTHESREISDYRFGRAPSRQPQLLQWRDDASAVTTDLSLQTLWNRVLLGVMLVSFGLLAAGSMVVRALKTDDAADGESPSRSTDSAAFGKRRA